MNNLLRLCTWPSFRASSGIVHCDVPFTGAPQVQHPAVAQWHDHLHGLAAAIHETFGLVLCFARNSVSEKLGGELLNSTWNELILMPLNFPGMFLNVIRPSFPDHYSTDAFTDKFKCVP